MAADGLTHSAPMPSAAMIMTLQDKQALLFQKEIFQLPMPSWTSVAPLTNMDWFYSQHV